MSRDFGYQLSSSAKSVYLKTGPRTSNPVFDHFEGSMLLQDIRSAVVPYKVGGGKSCITVEVEPQSRDASDVVAFFVNAQESQPDKAIEAFVREYAQTLLTWPNLYFEVERLSDPESGELKQIQLRPIQPWSVGRKGRDWIQEIPESDQEWGALMGESRPAAIEIPGESVAVIRHPSALRKKIDETFERLLRTPSSSLPAWQAEEMAEQVSNGVHTTPIVTEELQRRRDLAIAIATDEIGWLARGALMGKISEFHNLQRTIRWERFLCETRNSILGEVNRIARSALSELGISATFTATNAPTLDELDRLESELRQGGTTVGNVYSRLSILTTGFDIHAPTLSREDVE